MNKTIKIIGLLLVLLMGILVGCPTESPKEKAKSEDKTIIAPAEFVSETIKAGYAIFTYKAPQARKLGFLITARGEDVPTVADAEQIAKNFLGDDDVHGGYYRRDFADNQTRSILITMTNKAGTLNTADAASTLLSDSRAKNNTSPNGVLLVPASDYTLYVYDYALDTITEKDFRTTNALELANPAINIELLKETKNGKPYLVEPPVLSVYITSFDSPVAWSEDAIIRTTCASLGCTDYIYRDSTDDALVTKIYYFKTSDNMITTFITGNITATILKTKHAVLGSATLNISYVDK